MTPVESEELREEEHVLANRIERLKEATESQDEASIKNAKERLAKALTGSARGDFDNLTEIRRLSGKKAIYVRSDKIKNHWRTYSLNKDDRDKSFRTKDGKLDRKRILDRFTELKGKVSKEWNMAGDSLAGHENEFGRYIDQLNKSLEYSLQKNRQANPEDVHFDVTAGAQLLRYYANAGIEGEVDFKKMKFGLKANLNAAIALAEAKFTSEAYWPDQAGFEMAFTLNSKKTGKPVKFNFGKVRALLELSGAGFVAPVRSVRSTSKSESRKARNTWLLGESTKSIGRAKKLNRPIGRQQADCLPVLHWKGKWWANANGITRSRDKATVRPIGAILLPSVMESKGLPDLAVRLNLTSNTKMENLFSGPEPAW